MLVCPPDRLESPAESAGSAGSAESAAVRRGERFAATTTAVVAALPFGLSRAVPPSLLGFGLVNGFTFGLDLVLLTVLHGTLGVALPVAVTVGYVTAFGLSFLLNRTLNFRSHGRLGRQVPIYVAVVAFNYVALILGLTDALAAAGVDYRVARVLAGAAEAAFLYAAMRLLVFRDAARPAGR